MTLCDTWVTAGVESVKPSLGVNSHMAFLTKLPPVLTGHK